VTEGITRLYQRP